MHMFPPEHYLCGRTLFFEYNEQLVLDCLDFLRPQGMLVLLFNKSYSNMVNMAEEPWHGARYKCQDFDSPLISKLNNLGLNPDLSVPDPNPYIATNFSLVKAKKSTLYPVVVMNEASCRVWYKKDNNFFLPNAFIHFNLISSTLSKSYENVALSDVFLTLLLQFLTETLHNATLAGYEYSVEGSPEGIVFVIGGYSEKIKVVTKDTIHALQSLEVDEECFKSVVSHLKQVYIDALLNPLECARAVRYSLLENKDPSLLERFEQMDDLRFPKLLDYIEEFYQTLFVEALVTGNLSLKDAVEVGGMLKKLVKKPLAEKDFPKPSVMELPEGDFKCLIPAINKEDTNSCVMHYFQQGPGTFLSACLNDTLAALMTEPLFNNLRTKHQLGYSVFCQPAAIHAITGFVIVVESQANKFSMEYIDDLMNKFLKDFEKTLENLPLDKVNSVIESQASQLSSEDGDLYGEATRFWHEIATGAYVFDRPDQQRLAMDLVTRESLLEWLRLMTTDKRRKLTLMVEGCTRNNCKTTAPPTAQPLENIKSLMKNLRTCPVNNWETSQSVAKNSRQAAVHHQSQDHGQILITNLCDFKSKLKVLPYHVTRE
ncbi:insulin-degrading enzyme [Elysia marginata]|uniref:Insulin-degrading enzyme n=1 Tax=Elysia marginata TaxID=1093978 RepID=A0AAV4EW54_9GAST|nr:insulin-degrading enzyme [Elysia marginata]